jgi:hypothetical protein
MNFGEVILPSRTGRSSASQKSFSPPALKSNVCRADGVNLIED